jgi:hypothetical protein
MLVNSEKGTSSVIFIEFTSEQSKPAELYRALPKFVPFGVDPFYPQMSSQDFE